MEHFASFAVPSRCDPLRTVSAQTLLLAASLTVPRTSPGQTPRELVGSLPGTTLVVTVTEGSREPRSIGSYSLRPYAPSDPAWPYDNHAAGAMRLRDGILADLLFGDLDADGEPDIVVVVRSVGSGGYPSADGFIVRGQQSTFAGHVAGLRPPDDPLIRLECLVRRQRRLP